MIPNGGSIYALLYQFITLDIRDEVIGFVIHPDSIKELRSKEVLRRPKPSGSVRRRTTTQILRPYALAHSHRSAELDYYMRSSRQRDDGFLILFRNVHCRRPDHGALRD
jgi:hypothetical protein